MSIACALRTVSKSYPGIRACTDVTAEFHAGEIHALVGENGAGKSTLVKLLAGLLAPDTGHVEIGGAPAALGTPARARAAGVAVVHQTGSLIDALTVEENYRLAGATAPLGPEAVVPPAVLVGELAPSQRKLVEIDRLFRRARPRLLVLDEPTATLTPQESDALFARLRAVADAGAAVVVVTHRLPELTTRADRATFLHRGRVVRTFRRGADVWSEALAHWLRVVYGGAAPAAPPAQPVRGHAAGPDGVLYQYQPHAPSPPERPGRGVAAEAIRALQGLAECPARPPHAVLWDVAARPHAAADAPLDRVRLAFPRGSVIGVAGRPGCGAATLFGVLADRVAVAAGRVIRPAGRGRVGVIPADARGEGTVGEMSVAENLALRARWRLGWRPFADRLGAFAAEQIAAHDIRPGDPHLPADALSGGNRQKVVLARELAHGTDLVLATNPTAGLDLVAAARARAALVARAAAGGCVVVRSDDLDELAEIADAVVVMCRGRVTSVLGPAGLTALAIGQALDGPVDHPAAPPAPGPGLARALAPPAVRAL